MDYSELKVICGQVTKTLTPEVLEVVEYTATSFTLRIVSQQFEGMPSLPRFGVLSDLFENQNGNISKNFAFNFEAWTPVEFEQLGYI